MPAPLKTRVSAGIVPLAPPVFDSVTSAPLALFLQPMKSPEFILMNPEREEFGELEITVVESTSSR
jgi:hypothetical protein